MFFKILFYFSLFLTISFSKDFDQQYIKYISKFNSNHSEKINNIINKNLLTHFPKYHKVLKPMILAQCKVESDFLEKAIGDQGRSFGGMQVMLTTARHLTIHFEPMKKYSKYSKDELTNYLKTYEGSIEFGVSYLAFKKKYIKSKKSSDYGKFFKIFSLYNGGAYNFNYVDKVFNEADKILINS